MPRSKLIRSDTLPYHVTLRANNREPWPVCLDEAWKIFADSCLRIQISHKAEIQSFVMMTNHVHMKVTTPEDDLGQVMKTFSESATRSMHRVSGRSGHLFGGPYHRSLIRQETHFCNALKYIYQNPVRAGICSNVEDYPYSTLQGLLGKDRLPFPLFYPRAGLGVSLPSLDPADILDWMNRRISDSDRVSIKKALLKPEFSFTPDRISRRPNPLNFRLA